MWDQVRGLNQYIEEEKPWALAKNEETDQLNFVLSQAAGSLVEIAELLTPFLPGTAEKILHMYADGVIRPLDDASLFPRIQES